MEGDWTRAFFVTAEEEEKEREEEEEGETAEGSAEDDSEVIGC